MKLDEIIENKRHELEERKRTLPLESFRDRVTLSDRSLLEALTRNRTGFILEAKKASPSRGLIRSDFDPLRIAAAYAPFADAISVLTDRKYFQGSLNTLETIRRAVPQPVLCKDFILDPYQVYEARLYGADAILLMLSVLDDSTFRECFAVVEELQMDALVEVHTEEELLRAKALGTKIVGINNRNLKTFEVNLETTVNLAPKAREFAQAVICESGIKSHSDVLGLRDQVDAFLIGTSLMERSDLGKAVREIIFGPVKVCGLTRIEDARTAYSSGAVYGGMIFADNSPRRISLEIASQLVQVAPLRWTGVFVNAPAGMVADYARSLDLAAVQLHGDEDEAYVENLRSLLPGYCEIWKAYRVNGSIPDMSQVNADRHLLDAFDPALRGGTGITFNWNLLQGSDRNRIVLSGGLKPENAADADRVGAAMLDVNSGVENTPGEKDSAKLTSFFNQLRGIRERTAS